jgi:hypothetical protein
MGREDLVIRGHGEIDARVERLVVEFEAAYSRFRTSYRRTLEDARRAGQLLLKIKKAVGHGHWLEWLDEHGFVKRTAAEDLMFVAQEWERVERLPLPNSRHAGKMAISPLGSIRGVRRLLSGKVGKKAPRTIPMIVCPHCGRHFARPGKPVRR